MAGQKTTLSSVGIDRCIGPSSMSPDNRYLVRITVSQIILYDQIASWKIKNDRQSD